MVPVATACFGVQAFQLPKEGEDPAGCEDAFRIRGVAPDWDGRAASLDSRCLRAVLSDGATLSYRSRVWAKLLAGAFAGLCPPLSHLDFLHDRFSGLGREWQAQVEHGLARREWYDDQGLDDGAYASLLVLRLADARWRAEALGDSCLFLVRDHALAVAFPLDSPESFDRAPDLLCSVPHRNRRLQGRVRTASGTARPGDVFLLASDAVARWILEYEGWKDLLELAGEADPRAAFANLVGLERRMARLEDDDATVLVVKVP